MFIIYMRWRAPAPAQPRAPPPIGRAPRESAPSGPPRWRLTSPPPPPIVWGSPPGGEAVGMQPRVIRTQYKIRFKRNELEDCIYLGA
eukprot:6499812-Pyramimonas_sp.AAC.1